MLDTLSTTGLLAFFIGLYCLAVGIRLLTDRQSYAAMVEEIRNNTAMGFVMAILAFTIGAVIVAIHDVWTSPAAIVISLIGWLALAEGVALTILPRLYADMAGYICRNNGVMLGCALFSLALGIWLLYSAFA